MRLFIRAAAGVLLLLATVAGATAASVPGLATYKAARTEFDTLMATAQAEGTMPRLSDAKTASLLRTLSDVRGVLGELTVQKAELSELMDVCANNTPMTAYMMKGVNQTIAPDSDAEKVAEAVARLTEKNIFTYQDELFPLMAFNIHCIARTIPAMTDFAQTLSGEAMTESRKFALVRFQHSVLSTYMGAMLIFKDEAISPANRKILLDALADTANIYAGALQKELRQPIVTLTDGLRSKVGPDLQAWLERINAAMRREDCTGLCQL